MQFIVKLARWLLLLVLAGVIGGTGWLYAFPPDLFRVGSAYSAKIVCSNLFLARRDPAEVLRIDVQAPGHPLLKLMRVDVDEAAGTVRAGLFGLLGSMTAIHREGAGCTSVPDGDIGNIAPVTAAEIARPDANLPWPLGEQVPDAYDPALQSLLADDALAGPGMRAIVVARNGRIVAERYGEGFSAETPLLGWSMTKTVTAAIMGTLVKDGLLSLDRANLVPGWTDERAQISVADLLAMSSGLAFNEDYGDVTDVTRMLYLEPDMATFAADKPLVAPPGTRFSYSSGTTAILSRVWQDLFPDPAEARNWPRRALFNPLGMASATFETDGAGTFTGSSYLYATARDWVRFGELLRNDGKWGDREILPPGFVAMMRSPASTSGAYGRGHVWLSGPGGDGRYDIPDDAFWLRGHDGQSMTIIPSRGLVVLRLGLTPTKLRYRPQALVEAILTSR